MHVRVSPRGRDAADRQSTKIFAGSRAKVGRDRARIRDSKTQGFLVESADLSKSTDSRIRHPHGQAAYVDERQQRAFLQWVWTTRFPMRNEVIARLNAECGLRATEIGRARWSMAFDPAWRLRPRLQLHATASKGGYGARTLVIVPGGLGQALERLLAHRPPASPEAFIVQFRKGSIDPVIRSAAVQAFFRRGYDAIGCREASSHSGRRTAITRLSRALGLKNAQIFAGHHSSATTALYEEPDYAAIDRVVAERLVVQLPRKLPMAKAALRVMTREVRA